MPPRKSKSALEDVLQQLASEFTEQLVRALAEAHAGAPARSRGGTNGNAVAVPSKGRGAGASSKAKPPKRRATPRDSEAVIRRRSAALDRVVALLGKNPEGLRSEVIRAKLGLDKRLFADVVADGLDVGRLRKDGRLRATTYYAV